MAGLLQADDIGSILCEPGRPVGTAEVGVTATSSCRSCGAVLLEDARFCHVCGSPSTSSGTTAEYKQVTVLFADVVHSMDLAAAVGAERLREIMAELVRRAASIVQRYGGKIDKFTGDGIMALFGAPVALEDHAFRACVAALGIQEETAKLAVDLKVGDGIDLSLRIGLNSGQVIAGELGSGPSAYTAIGAQVGMAQRMESAAPPGGIMVSESTARLVDAAVVLAETELLHIKGADAPVPARRLLASSERRHVGGQESTSLFGRTWEMNTISGILDEAIGGAGCVVCVLGPPGIGKSRLIRESTALAAGRGVEVITTHCESHTSDIPFHAVARLLRAGFGVSELGSEAARAHVRVQVPGADPEDLLLLDDLLGIADPGAAQPMIDGDARRRRLTALVNAAALARTDPALYVIEDAHWIDDVSESMLADFLSVITQTQSAVLITYRPEYRGALTRVPAAQAISLRPLNSAQASALIGELLGPGAMTGAVPERIAERAAGNPFFAEEIVRDLAERGLLEGERGTYSVRGDVAEVSVPATLQATIAARIDRLEPSAKRTLGAAAVVGMRFSHEDLESLEIEPAFDGLVSNELIDQVQFTQRNEFAFRHPLIRAVAYEAQLTADRAKLHRRLAGAIQARDPESADENAALIAEHLEAAGDLNEAFEWHMKAGDWLTYRDIAAARASWHRARNVADRLPRDNPDRSAMRIAPRTMLSASAFRGLSVGDTGYEELRDLCVETGDHTSLAIGMAGLSVTLMLQNRHLEAAKLATEQARLLESIGDPVLTVALLHAAMTTKMHSGEMAEALRLAQLLVDLADGDVNKGLLLIGSPLAQAIMVRGIIRCCLGDSGCKEDFEQAVDLARGADALTKIVTAAYPYVVHIPTGALLPDATAMSRTADALRLAEQYGDDFALGLARMARITALRLRDDTDHEAEVDLLRVARESPLQSGNKQGVMLVDCEIAAQELRTGHTDDAIELSRTVVDDSFDGGEVLTRAPAVTVLVESLLRRGTDADVQEAEAAFERLATVTVEPGFVLFELPLLRMRALLARAHGDETGYREFRDRYRERATSLGFEGHVKVAAAMP